MNFIPSQNRHQMWMSSLESSVEHDNPVRLIDAFVDRLDLVKLKFRVRELKKEGRPAFESIVFLKLYFYGYLNGLRSSRRLERECCRNIELQWLMGGLKPNYHSIADFRKHNPLALRNTFKLFVLFLKDSDLVSGKIVAVDGTKVRANNSKKNNYNEKKIERHLSYIENKTAEYLADLDRMDAKERKEFPDRVKAVKKKILQLKENKIKYEALGDMMADDNEPQISTTDPDSRALLVQGQVVEVCYNVQAAVDSEHSLVVATHVINRNDRNALSDIALEAKSNLSCDEMTVLADKGYHNGREISECVKAGISTIVATPEIVNSNEGGTTEAFMVDKFVYNEGNDTYTCPAGHTLRTHGTWHTKKRTSRAQPHRYKKYRTSECKSCSLRDLCTSRAKGGREIERSEYGKELDQNKQRYENERALYRKRQEINEHIFGTIKRQWGYSHTQLRGLKNVNGEISFIMTIYNFKRLMNIWTYEDFLNRIKNWKPDYSKIRLTLLINDYYISIFSAPKFFSVISHRKLVMS